MTIINYRIIKSLLVCVLAIFSSGIIGEAAALDYYIGTDGSDSNSGSLNEPWATFTYAMTKLKPGDTLYIKDGIYYQALNVTVSGTSGNPVTIKALNDGSVTIDGQYSRIPIKISNQSWINIEGIVAMNSGGDVVQVSYSGNINIRRVSGYNARNNSTQKDNKHVFSIYHSTNVLIEDAAASGTGRKMYQAYESQNIIFRRCWGRFINYWRAPNTIVSLYGSDNTLVENCIGTQASEYSGTVKGVSIATATYNDTADRNIIIGNVMYDLSEPGFRVYARQHLMQDNAFIHNVSIHNAGGIYQYGDDNLTMEYLTLVGSGKKKGYYGCSPADFPNEQKDNDYRWGGSLKNSSLLNNDVGIYFDNTTQELNGSACQGFKSFTHEFNNLWNNNIDYSGSVSKGTGETYLTAAYDTSTYGRGAYLIVPVSLQGEGENGTDIGAKVIYRYENGILTNNPLWPWPMEDRICAETGYSVTYENGYPGCPNGGGLWKTLDGVYASTSQQAPVSTVDVDPSGTYIEAEDYTGTIMQGTATFSVASALSGYNGSGYLVSNGGSAGTCPPVNEGKEYQLNFTQAGTYNVWIRGYAVSDNTDSVFVGLDGNCVGALTEAGMYNEWTWTNGIQNGSNTIDVPTVGIHTLNIWVRESNHLLDQIYLTQGTELPYEETVMVDSTPPAPPTALVIE